MRLTSCCAHFDGIVVTASVARLAADPDPRFRQFLIRALDIYRTGETGVDGIEVGNGSRLFSTFAKEGFPEISLVIDPVGRTTVALATDY